MADKKLSPEAKSVIAKVALAVINVLFGWWTSSKK